MIFQYTWEKVLSEEKTQTRRIVKLGESHLPFEGRIIDSVWSANRNLKWRVGKDYAICPGRGKKAVGRIRITAIRKERVNEISEADALEEGCKSDYRATARDRFFAFWDSIHPNVGERVAERPDVWVLEFERVAGRSRFASR